MLDYIRVGCAVPRVSLGDPAENAQQICEWIERADHEKCDIVVFPELALTGYSCADLFFQNELLEIALTGLRRIAAVTADCPDLTTVVGLPLRIDGRLYNCAAVLKAGKLLGIVPKSFVPNHGEFDEKRWFASAYYLKCCSLDSAQLGFNESYAVPVSSGQVFHLQEGAMLGVEICEDLWAPQPPSVSMALRGAEVIVNLAASNEAADKRMQRQQLVCGQSERLHCIYVFCSAGKEESTQDLLFSGHSIIAENGAILSENNVIADSDYLLVMDGDLGTVRAERLCNTSFRDACDMIGNGKDLVYCVLGCDNLRSDGRKYPVNKEPFRVENWLDIFNIQVEGLKRRLETVGAKPVVGVSGGVDSTLALLVSVEAVRRLGRPLTDVHGLTMPCFGTTERTCGNAEMLMESLGITAKRIDIQEAVNSHFLDIGHDPMLHDITYENSQARERTQILMDYAGSIGGIVVGTGDMSELALGWCTYNGDHMSMYSVNASVTKTQIPHIIRSVSELPEYSQIRHVLADVIATPISPELLPPDKNGQILQQTEDIVGPYELHDFFLYYVLKYGFTPRKIYTLACRAFLDIYDSSTVKKWLCVFYRRFFSQQYKRSCMPEGVKTCELSLSPRGDWRMPSDAVVVMWLKQIDSL